MQISIIIEVEFIKKNSNNQRGAHAVAVIGFNDIHQCWVAKNSWGDDWAKMGFLELNMVK